MNSLVSFSGWRIGRSSSSAAVLTGEGVIFLRSPGLSGWVTTPRMLKKGSCERTLRAGTANFGVPK